MLQSINLADIDKDALNLEDLFCIVYCVSDDYYKLLIGSKKNLRLSNNRDPVFTDAEVITIALVGELKGENSERSWWRVVNKNYRHLFPHLCDRTRYGRRLRKLKYVMEMIRQQFLFQLDVNFDRYRLVDSFPLRLLKLQRLRSSSCPFEYSATVGYCDSFKEYFYGFKVHILMDLRGIPISFVLTPGHPHDTQGFKQLLNEMIELRLNNVTLIVVGDKGYVGEEYAKHLKDTYGIELLAIKRQYNKDIPESALNGLLSKTRRIIETTNSVLTEVMNANWTYCRSIKGLITRMVTKMTAFNLANYLNSLLQQPLLEIKGFAN
jgi:Transposase DDE domain